MTFLSGTKYDYPPEASKEMFLIMNESKDSITYKRAQSVYLRSKYNYSPKEISKITGLSISRVNDIHSLYNKHGSAIIFCGKRGGRNNANLQKEEESKFLEQYQDQSMDGEIITAGFIHRDLEAFLSKNLHKSGIYKLLKRNHWKKILPRPQHPDHDQEAINDYKKNSQY